MHRPIDHMENDVLASGAFVVALCMGIIFPVIPAWSDALILMGGAYCLGHLLVVWAKRRYINSQLKKFREELDHAGSTVVD